MKKVLPFIISIIIMTIANCSFAATAIVNVSAARIREKASTESGIVINAYKDDEVEILEENGEWSKVKYSGKTGYTKTEFLTKKGETSQKPATELPEDKPVEKPAEKPIQESQVEVEQPTENANEVQEPSTLPNAEKNIGDSVSLTNSVKVRVIPNLSASANEEIAQGGNVVVLAKLGNWYKIGDGSVSGWILKLKIDNGATSSEVVTEPVTTPEEKPEKTPEPEPEPVQNTTTTENVVTEKPVQKPQENKVSENTVTESTDNLNKTAVVNVETARIREKASTTSDIVEMLDKGDKVTIIGEEGEFYKIKTDKISAGYISKKLLSEKAVTSRGNIDRENNVGTENIVEEPEVQEISKLEDTVDEGLNETVNQILEQEPKTSISGVEVVEFAKQYLGYKYVSGGSTPQSGFDCSGFTRYIFDHFGYKLGRVAASQTSVGAVVERENLQTGDLILFYDDAKTKIGHCGIYINGGDFIHSANPKRGVVIDNLNTNSYYNQRFVTARRVVEK